MTRYYEGQAAVATKKGASDSTGEAAIDGETEAAEAKKAAEAKAGMLLRSEFWTGQQHGGRSGIAHARHMRPMCEIVSSGKP